MKKISFCLLLIFVGLSSISAQDDISGHWYFMVKYGLDGSISIENDQAYFQIPLQGVNKAAAQQTKWSQDTLIASWAAPLSTSVKMVYLKDLDIIKAVISTSGKKVSRVMTRISEPLQFNRPQTPKAPFPYAVEEVFFTNSIANINLAGTLTTPRGVGPFPGIVLVTGSGPQNRDEEILGHRSFAVIADFLTRSGIAVLRYDDRGIGESKGKFMTATTSDFADDAEAGVQYLSKDKRIDKNMIGMLGHSEGGMIAPMVASRNDLVSYLILLAGPATPITDLLNKQNELIHTDKKKSDEFLTKNEIFNDRLYALLNTGQKNSDLYAPMLELVHDYYESQESEEDKKYLGTTKELYYMALASQVFSPWFRYFIAFDSEEYLSQVDCPILGLFGKKDLQVYWKDSAEGLENISKKYGNEKIDIINYAEHNHLFQRCLTGSVEEYGVIEHTISPEVLLDISEWILQITK
jgi:pimeloyl-ACP methyl ester carboxylesterase